MVDLLDGCIGMWNVRPGHLLSCIEYGDSVDGGDGDGDWTQVDAVSALAKWNG